MKVAVYGVFGIGNVGNDESGRVMIELLRDRYPDAELWALSGGADAAADLGVPTVTLTRSGGSRAFVARLFSKLLAFPDLVRAVGAFDAIVVSGTGLLESRRRLPGGDLVWLWLLSIAGRLRRVPVSWFAIGGSRRMALAPRAVARAALGLTAYTSFRDTATPRSLGSRRALREPVIPDLVFGRRADLSAAPRERTATAVAAATIGVAVIDYDQTDPVEEERYYTTIADATSELIDRGAQVVFLLGDSADRAPTDRVRGVVESRHPDASLRSTPFGRFADIHAAAAECDAVVASRFHVLIAAGMAGTPVVAVSHAAKDDTLFEQWDLSDYCLPAPRCTPTEIVDATEAALADAPAVSSALRRSTASFADAVRAERDRASFVTSASSGRTPR